MGMPDTWGIKLEGAGLFFLSFHQFLNCLHAHLEGKRHA